MKLKEQLANFSKPMMYDRYLSIVYDNKEYESITKNKMIDKIINEYSQKDFLYHICTKKELEFLDLVYHNKLNLEEAYKYDFCIRELRKKCILAEFSLDIYDEQKENVEKALILNKKAKVKSHEDIVIFMVSAIKINAEMLEEAFISMIKGMFNISSEDVEHLMMHPLFHFYCGFISRYIDSLGGEKTFIVYREYYDFLDELFYARKKYGLAGMIEKDIRDNYDIFYYGYPIRNKKVKKMYDMVSGNIMKDYIFSIVDKVRVLNNRDMLSRLMDDDELIKIINEALDEMPIAAMNGFTPKQYLEEKKKEKEYNKRFVAMKQENAHLSKKEKDEYYKLYFAILEYVNNKYKISKIKKIYKQKGLNPMDLMEIDDFLWSHKEVIDEFILDNEYKFEEEELNIISNFKSAIKSEPFIIVGFDRDYTKILGTDGKLYMVKGVTSNMDEVVINKELPIIIDTTLVQYRDKIIFCSLLKTSDIKLGNDIKEVIYKDYLSAIKCYHL